ncbi:MAG: biopolymer transporter ExbD [Rhodothalassiaceae bacterium]|nr:MAG: biopolymer transporter ExbD [Rhodothalassiaceae bacterium]
MREKQQEEELEINMTPMLDIVFIMLIFFIVTATFMKEAGVTVEKPEALTGERQDQASIIVAVTDKDEVWVNKQVVDIKALRPLIEKLHAENPKGTVVIEADRDARAGLMIQVADAIQAAGVGTVAVSTEERR